MPIKVQCTSCSKVLTVRDELAGKKGKCPGCGTVFTLVSVDVRGDQPPAPKGPAPKAPPPKAPPPKTPVDDLPVAQELDDDEDDGTPYSMNADLERLAGAPAHRDEEDEEEDEEDRTPARKPRGKKRAVRKSSGGWETVRTGITLILTAMLLQVSSPFWFCCWAKVTMTTTLGAAAALAPMGANPHSTGLALAGGFMMVLLALFGPIILVMVLQIAGQAFCLAAPEKYGSKSYARASLTMTLLGLILTCASVGLSYFEAKAVARPSRPSEMYGPGGHLIVSPPPAVPESPFSWSMPILLIGIILSLVQIIAFLHFLQAVAFGVRDDRLGHRIEPLISFGKVMAGMNLALLLLLIGLGLYARSLAAAGDMESVSTVVRISQGIALYGVLCLVVSLVFLVWYLTTLFHVRAAIGNFLDD